MKVVVINTGSSTVKFSLIESAGETQGLRRITYVPTPDAIYLEISEVLFAQARRDPTSMMDTPPRGGPRVLGPDV